MVQSVGAKAGQGSSPASGQEPREWTKVRERLRAEYGEGTFRSWFKLISYGDMRSGTMIFAPHGKHRERRGNVGYHEAHLHN